MKSKKEFIWKHPTSFSLPVKTKEKLIELAEKEGKTMTAVLVRLIDKEFSHDERSGKT